MFVLFPIRPHQFLHNSDNLPKNKTVGEKAKRLRKEESDLPLHARPDSAGSKEGGNLIYSGPTNHGWPDVCCGLETDRLLVVVDAALRVEGLSLASLATRGMQHSTSAK